MTERLVVFAPNWLGDAVMALPAFADVRRHFSSAHIAVAARPAVAPMYAMVSGVDEVITLPGGGGFRAWTGWREDVRALDGGSFDTAILFPNSYATARIASKANIGERWGYAADMRGGMLTRAIAKPSGELHQRAYYQALTTALGIPEGPPYASIHPNRDKARQLLRDIGLDLDEPFVVFAPGAAYGRAKQWLPERYAELAGLIINERNWSVVMVGAGVDRSACDDIERRMPKTGTRMNRLIDFCGKSDCRRSPASRRGACVVPNDSARCTWPRGRYEGDCRVRADAGDRDRAALVGRRRADADRHHTRCVLPTMYASRVSDRSPMHETDQRPRRLPIHLK